MILSAEGPSHHRDSSSGNSGPATGAILPRVTGTLSLCIFSLCALLLNFGCEPANPSQTGTPIVEQMDPDTFNQPPFLLKLPSATAVEPMVNRPELDLLAPRYMGLRQLVAGDGELLLAWSSAVDDQSSAEEIRYQVFTSDRSGKQDFEAPPLLLTEAGAISCRLSGLENGQTVHVVVRAIDASGKSDDNEIEWSAIPNPVLFVDGSKSESGSGDHPLSALHTIDEAIGTAIGLPGVNIYVAEGTYPEQFLLFDGMSIYGGFSDDFANLPTPGANRTVLLGNAGKDSIILPPGKNLVVIDGITFLGEGKARRAIVADDCVLRISHCNINHFADKGVQIETDNDDGGEATGSLLYCDIDENLGDGLRIEGFVDLNIRECRFRNNQQSGISSPSLQPRHGEKTRIEFHRVEISGNGDIGLNIRISEPDDGNPEDPPRVRLGLLGVDCHNNKDHGFGLDLRYSEQDSVDLRIRIENCSVRENNKSGIYLDADAPGDYSIRNSQMIGNLGTAGLLLSGDSAKALVRVRESQLDQNGEYGALQSGSGLLSLMKCSLHSNGTSAYHEETRGFPSVQVIDCVTTPPEVTPDVPKTRMWSSVGRLPQGAGRSGEIDSLPAPLSPRATEVIGIDPAIGSFDQGAPLRWTLFLNQSAPTPLIQVTLDGQTLKSNLIFTDDSCLISCPEVISSPGELDVQVTIPAHLAESDHTWSYRFKIAGDR